MYTILLLISSPVPKIMAGQQSLMGTEVFVTVKQPVEWSP